MSITVMQSYPEISWWRKLLRKICGGQDIVLVIYVGSDGSRAHRYLTGIDMRNPIHMGLLDQKEFCNDIS